MLVLAHHLGANIETPDGRIPMRVVVRQQPDGQMAYYLGIRNDGRLEAVRAARGSSTNETKGRPGGRAGGRNPEQPRSNMVAEAGCRQRRGAAAARAGLQPGDLPAQGGNDPSTDR